jgi:hypothetical protein
VAILVENGFIIGDLVKARVREVVGFTLKCQPL